MFMAWEWPRICLSTLIKYLIKIDSIQWLSNKFSSPTYNWRKMFHKLYFFLLWNVFMVTTNHGYNEQIWSVPESSLWPSLTVVAFQNLSKLQASMLILYISSSIQLDICGTELSKKRYFQFTRLKKYW